jgi:DNA-binding NarL/FixJ family response regulator
MMNDKTRRAGKRTMKILIVDDHPLMREGLASRIAPQADMEVCGEAASVDEALTQVKATNPDLVIVDIALADSNGIDLIKDVKARFPNIKMLVVSAYDESLYAERALRAGAHGYVNKQEVQEKVIDAIRAVLDGERYLSLSMTQKLVGQAIVGKDLTESDPIQRLSDRELEVFQLIGQGKTTGAIAEQLFLSVHTIDTHREKLRHKLGVKNGAELMRRAVQWTLENG